MIKNPVFSKFIFIFAALGILLTTGCAHEIKVVPSLDNIRRVKVENVIDKNVGYYIAPELKALEVKSGGGGGDSVTYFPYKDTEGALNTMLSKAFKRVYALKSKDDKTYISEKNITYIFTPTLVTSSSSDSILLWPPTKFTINLTLIAVNSDGETVWQASETGIGTAASGEITSDFSITARRAAESVFQTMLSKIIASDKFK